MVRAHSIGRVEISPSDVPDEVRGEVDEMRRIIVNVVQDGAVDHDAQTEFESAAMRLVGRFGYGSAGDSNSIWGRQERLTDYNSPHPARPQALCDAARAAGLPANDLRDEDGWQEVHVFVPDIRRYLPFDHPMNAPESDLAIAEHTTYDGEPTHIEVGGRVGLLDEMAAVVKPEEFDREAMVLRFHADALDDVETAAQNRGWSYSLFPGAVTCLPTLEYDPALDAGEYVVAKQATGWNSAHQVHAVADDGGLACGASVSDMGEYRKLLPSTMIRRAEWDDVDYCGHAACQSRFGGVADAEEERKQATLG